MLLTQVQLHLGPYHWAMWVLAHLMPAVTLSGGTLEKPHFHFPNALAVGRGIAPERPVWHHTPKHLRVYLALNLVC